jgi:hypothetical protein
MTLTDIQLRPARRVLRQFAVAFFVFGIGWGVVLWVRGYHRTAAILAGAGFVIGLAGLIAPSTIRWLFVGCMVLAFPIGWLISQVALALVFYLLITPIALFFRLRGRDALQLKRPLADASLWKPKTQPDDIRRYFRQY